jgi:hypothetical protein
MRCPRCWRRGGRFLRSAPNRPRARRQVVIAGDASRPEARSTSGRRAPRRARLHWRDSQRSMPIRIDKLSLRSTLSLGDGARRDVCLPSCSFGAPKDRSVVRARCAYDQSPGSRRPMHRPGFWTEWTQWTIWMLPLMLPRAGRRPFAGAASLRRRYDSRAGAHGSESPSAASTEAGARIRRRA